MTYAVSGTPITLLCYIIYGASGGKLPSRMAYVNTGKVAKYHNLRDFSQMYLCLLLSNLTELREFTCRIGSFLYVAIRM